MAVALFATGPAYAAATDWVGDDRAAVRLITASQTTGAGLDIEAGIQFRFGSGWHGAWRNPGDAGLAPSFDWAGSQGVGTPEIAWPAPHRLSVAGLETFVYDDGVVLPVRFARLGDGPVRLQVSLRHAVCGEVCIPYRATLTLALDPGASKPSEQAQAIASAQSLVPWNLSDAGITVRHAGREGDARSPRLTLTLLSEGQAFVAPDLFVEGAVRAATASPTVILSEGGRRARLSVALPQVFASEQPLRLTLVDGRRTAEFAFAPNDTDWAGILAIFATALLGGLVLNAMPCVLPVLSLKAFALARHAGMERRAVRRGLVATASGIIASFILIGIVLALLQASGVVVGWGIQFQQPWFLVGMALLTVLFAASLFEWIGIGLPGPLAAIAGRRGAGPLSEAFLTGAFATLLATPCSAPFVGSAVGFALTQRWPAIVGVFSGLGVGMALPFLLLALRPGLVRLLPRPGGWMRWLRVGLGLLLMVTALWLLMVFAQVAGAARAGIAAGILAALLAWLFRRRHGTGRRAATALLTACALAPLALPPPATPALDHDGRAVRLGMNRGWQAFAPAAIPGLVAEGRVVLVDVTAAWCLTCKLNDLTTFDRPEARARLASGGVIAMRADWSQPDPEILAFLRRFGRFGIPLVAVFGPGRPEGELLPELLTQQSLLLALARAEGDQAPTTSQVYSR